MKLIKTLTLFSAVALSPGIRADELPDFTALIKENAKTVVQIDSQSSPTAARGSSKHPNDLVAPEDLLRYFFEGPGFGPSPMQPRTQRPSRSHGSGFFIDDKGYILTNAHVVKGGDDITVSTTDRKEYAAELIGLDERTDVALLKIKHKKSPAAKIGNSDTLEVGNWVLAIGSPFGFDYTATKGIVSAVSRSLPDGTYVPFIQTDAAVNPGNSGGPLFNLKGEVIGINSQIYSNTGSFNGLAFAIPINTAMNIAKQLREKGFVSRGWLGVAIQNVDHNLANSFGLDSPTGALVSSVVEDSPAEDAGIRAGDIILSFNGQTIDESADLPPIVGTVSADSEVDVEIMRNGKKKTLSVTVGELDEGEKVTGNKKQSVKNKGLTVAELTAKQRKALSVEQGVVIQSVAANSKAAKAGFRAGDVIININNIPVKNTKSFKRAMKNLPDDKPSAILVIRKGRSLFIAL